MKEELLGIKEQALSDLAAASSAKDIEDVKVAFLGKKGKLTLVLKKMGALSAQERPVIGKIANEVRQEIELRVEEAKALIKQ
ncbi:MAG: phenylalanine--tRNA ligase subunit alpha, partial [Firmicutes bacterium]|nr:phenylalanine--tRNA ligase subunit alpha [Bacillota bacterium]